jgi:autotransporter-associated beta strand protein
LAGPIADNFTLNGGGDVTFTYSGLAPNTLVLSGDFSSTQNLIFDVVNGSTAEGSTATLELTGTIDDTAASIGLTKIGNGTLKLAGGNTYSGVTTIQKGMLSLAADSALGDSTADLVIDGGCLLSTASFTLGRDLVFGANGGSVRGSVVTALNVPALEWGAGTSAFFGPGQTILSGTTTGSGGDLALGIPTAFATSSSSLTVGSGHVLSLRGTAALPAGNLNFANNAVLELGNGDFTRALGTGPGEVQLATAVGGGWAAHGANRAVNLGGASAAVVWGQQSPPVPLSSCIRR